MFDVARPALSFANTVDTAAADCWVVAPPVDTELPPATVAVTT
jgi:hypothetical protein